MNHYTGIVNIYHLFFLHNIKEVLVDKKCFEYLDSVFNKISSIHVDFNITEPLKPDYISRKSILQFGTLDLLQNSSLKKKYDLLIVHKRNFNIFTPFMHRCFFIYVYTANSNDPTYLPYTKINDCFEGILYVNDFLSMTFPTTRLNVFEQTYIRDKPFRFLQKTKSLIKELDMHNIVEIGSCRTEMKHNINVVNPICCNDSHSTFFWCQTNCNVKTVDISPLCKTLLENSMKNGILRPKGKLEIFTGDGIQFLKSYNGPPIDFLFLDAWDVVYETGDFAKKHLEAFNACADKLSETCLLAIDDTDIAQGGKGKLLIPHLLQNNWLILFKGRHTVLYRGSIEKLETLDPFKI